MSAVLHQESGNEIEYQNNEIEDHNKEIEDQNVELKALPTLTMEGTNNSYKYTTTNEC